MNVWEAGLGEYLPRFFQNPTDIPITQKIYECYSKDEKIQNVMAENLCADARFKELYSQWYLAKPIDLDQLIKLPSNTFGYLYADHMKKNNLDPNFIGTFEGRTVSAYLWVRAAHVHDIGHLLSGFDTSLPGEIAQKGFELAQYRSPATAAIFGGGFLTISAMDPNSVGSMFEEAMKGYIHGKKFPMLMGIKWDEEWATPMDELRAKYGIPEPYEVFQ